MDVAVAALDDEARSLLVDSRQLPPELVELRLIKASTNTAAVRKSLPAAGQRAPQLLNIDDHLLSVEFELAARQGAPRSREPVPEEPASEPQSVLHELFSLKSDSEVRQRKSGVDKTEVNQYQQDQLSSDLVEMAAAIKRNAQLFQEKLDRDGDLVATTGDAMHKTSGNMSSVGSRLSQYRRESQLGWMFYIWSALFILFALVFGMALIQVFHKW